MRGDAKELLQRTVDVDPDQADVLARVLAADPAGAAVAARRDRPDRDALPGREARRAVRPDLLDDRRELVPLDPRVQLAGSSVSRCRRGSSGSRSRRARPPRA